MKTLHLNTSSRTEFLEVTSLIQGVIKKEAVDQGICYLFVPHTTAGLTVNENADPTVARDILVSLNDLVPLEGDYRHLEGNSAAHIKASLMGSSISLVVENGKLVLGTWQGIFFCEFDGPRSRKLHVEIINKT